MPEDSMSFTSFSLFTAFALISIVFILVDVKTRRTQYFNFTGTAPNVIKIRKILTREEEPTYYWMLIGAASFVTLAVFAMNIHYYWAPKLSKTDFLGENTTLFRFLYLWAILLQFYYIFCFIGARFFARGSWYVEAETEQLQSLGLNDRADGKKKFD